MNSCARIYCTFCAPLICFYHFVKYNIYDLLFVKQIAGSEAGWRQGYRERGIFMTISSSSFSEQSDVASCTREEDEFIHERRHSQNCLRTSDYGDVCSIRAEYVTFYVVLIYEWELLMLMGVVLCSFNYRVACFVYSQENNLFQMPLVICGGFNYKFYSPNINMIFACLMDIRWMHLVSVNTSGKVV